MCDQVDGVVNGKRFWEETLCLRTEDSQYVGVATVFSPAFTGPPHRQFVVREDVYDKGRGRVVTGEGVRESVDRLHK